jgi:hypothetical protein
MARSLDRRYGAYFIYYSIRHLPGYNWGDAVPD